MASSHLLKLGTVKGKNGVLVALRHNKRELQAERGSTDNIDAIRTPFNYCLAGNSAPSDIATHAKVQMLKAGIEKTRINAVLAVEVLFSLPIDRHSHDTKPFFNDCLVWTKKNFNCEILSFDVHLDEAAPHAHALLLPLIDNKMQGNSVMGGTGNLYRLINLFHKEVAHRYGLSKPNYKRLSASDKQSIEQQVLMRLKGDSVLKSSIWAWVRDAIHKDPMQLAKILGIEKLKSTQNTNKSFTKIMTSKGKGKAYETENTI